MSETIDGYSDQFQITTGPFGASLTFSVSPPTPPAPGSAPQTETVATIRMSLEHVKVMAFMLRRQLIEHQGKTGVQVQLPREVLNSLQIGPEDWDAFWSEGG